MNASKDQDSERICPECGAVLPPGTERCWLCRSGTQPAVTESASPSAPAERRAPIQFSLASLMLLITLWAVVLGVFSISPGVGIGLMILATPAVIRTVILASRGRTGGRPMPVGAKVWVFTGTLGLLAIIAVAVSAAFVVTCFPLGLAAFGSGSELIMLLAWVVGIAAGLLVFYGLFRWFRRLWPRGD